MDIVASTFKIEINIVGNYTKQTYLGTFEVKCILTPLEKINADKRYRSLLGENITYASDSSSSLAFALCQLEQRIIEAPPFWDNRIIGGGHVKDDNVIIDVFNKAIEAEEEFLMKKEQEQQDIKNRLQQSLTNGNIKKTSDNNEEPIGESSDDEEFVDLP